MSQEDHFQRLARLLEIEARAETRQALERVQRLSPAEAEATGNCLAGLVVREEFSGLGGRCVVTLGKRNDQQPLPWTRLGVGSPVLLSETGARPGDGTRGVVSERGERWLRVAFNDALDDEGGTTYRLDLSTDEVATQRQRTALHRARAAKRDRLSELRAVLLGERPPEF